MLHILRWMALALLTAACGSPASPAATSPTPSNEASAPPSAGPPQLAEGAVAMEDTCVSEHDERCDALDSDCDGRIDEGCDGALSGELDVAAAWNGVADLDLTLEGPQTNAARSVAAAGGCEAGGDGGGDGAEQSDGLERIERRSLERAAPGHYAVGLRHVDDCGGDGTVTASVSVSVGGRVVGTFNREVPTGARVSVVELDVE